jgi:hypothetical protein
MKSAEFAFIASLTRRRFYAGCQIPALKGRAKITATLRVATLAFSFEAKPLTINYCEQSEAV